MLYMKKCNFPFQKLQIFTNKTVLKINDSSRQINKLICLVLLEVYLTPVYKHIMALIIRVILCIIKVIEP